MNWPIKVPEKRIGPKLQVGASIRIRHPHPSPARNQGDGEDIADHERKSALDQLIRPVVLGPDSEGQHVDVDTLLPKLALKDAFALTPPNLCLFSVGRILGHRRRRIAGWTCRGR